jgi:hypothetical protein
LEHLANAGNARLLVPESIWDLIEQFTDRPGEEIPVPDGGEKPQWLQPAPLAEWIVRITSMVRAHLDDIMGLHEVSRGIAPPNIESGLGVSILAEKDSSPVGRLIKETAKAWSKVGRMVLKLYETEVSAKRPMPVSVGLAGHLNEYSGKMLHSQTHAVVPIDSIVPRSQAAQLAFAQQLVQMGLITDPVAFARVAEVPGLPSFIAAVAPDVDKAQRENAEIAAGGEGSLAEFDDDAVHIQVHNDWRKTVDYEMADEEVRRKCDAHVRNHEVQAARKAADAQNRANVSENFAGVPRADGAPPAMPTGPTGPDAPPPAEEPINPPEMTDPAALTDYVITQMQEPVG